MSIEGGRGGWEAGEEGEWIANCILISDFCVLFYFSGELLLDQQRFEDAVEKFDSAIAFAKEQ